MSNTLKRSLSSPDTGPGACQTSEWPWASRSSSHVGGMSGHTPNSPIVVAVARLAGRWCFGRLFSWRWCFSLACGFGFLFRSPLRGSDPRTDFFPQVSPSMFWVFGSLHQKPRVGGPLVVSVVTDQMVGVRRSPGATILGARWFTSSANHRMLDSPTGSEGRDGGAVDGVRVGWSPTSRPVRRCGVISHPLSRQP